MESNAQQRLLRLAQEATDRLLAVRDDILAVYVYGSVGRGEATPFSDLDLHVVVNRSEPLECDHEHEILDGVRVEYAYHTPGMYEKREWTLDAAFIEKAARSEGLFELADAVILHDPQDLVPPAQERARAVASDSRVTRARVRLSLTAARQRLAEARDALDAGDWISVYVLLFHLTGGDGSAGVAPLLAKAVTQRAGFALSTRRYLHRADLACRRTDRPKWHGMLVNLIGFAGSMDAAAILERFMDSYRSAESLFRRNVHPAEFAVYEAMFHPDVPDRIRAEIENLAEVASPLAAHGLLVGRSTRAFADDAMTIHSWVRDLDAEETRDYVAKVAQVAGLIGDLNASLRERVEIAERLIVPMESE